MKCELCGNVLHEPDSYVGTWTCSDGCPLCGIADFDDADMRAVQREIRWAKEKAWDAGADSVRGLGKAYGLPGPRAILVRRVNPYRREGDTDGT